MSGRSGESVPVLGNGRRRGVRLGFHVEFDAAGGRGRSGEVVLLREREALEVSLGRREGCSWGIV